MKKTLIATTLVFMTMGTAHAASVDIPVKRFDFYSSNSASFVNDPTKLASIIERFGGRFDQGTIPSNPITQLFESTGDASGPNLSSVPVPAAFWLLAPALGFFAAARRKAKS